MNYNPQVDDVITLNLPDEITRAKIIKLVSKTAALAELLNFTTGGKSHSYRKGDTVACRFGRTPMGLQGWTVISERELEASAKPEEVPPEKHEIREMTMADIFGPAERKAKGKKDAAAAR